MPQKRKITAQDKGMIIVDEPSTCHQQAEIHINDGGVLFTTKLFVSI